MLQELKDKGDEIIGCGTEREEWDQRLEDARAKFKQVSTCSLCLIKPNYNLIFCSTIVIMPKTSVHGRFKRNCDQKS